MAYGLIGSLPIAPATTNLGLAGMNQALQTGQNLLQTQFMPAMMNSQIGLNQARAGLYGGEGQYFAGRGTYYDQLASNLANGYSTPEGQAFLLSQSLANNPNVPQNLVTGAQNNVTRLFSGLPPNSPLNTALATNTMQNMNPSIFSGAGITPQAFAQQQFGNVASQIAEQNQAAAEKQAQAQVGIPAEAAASVAEAQQRAAQANNLGSPYGYGVSASVPQSLPQTQYYGAGQQPAAQGQYDFTQSYNQWQPEQQSEYLANNNVVPPLPSGTPINMDVDPKTEAKINAILPTAQNTALQMQLAQDPAVQQYMGMSASARIARLNQYMATHNNSYDPAYLKYENLVRVGTALNDAAATAMTGSRSLGAMNQFNQALGAGKAISPQQYIQGLKTFGQAVYQDANGYVGQNYSPAIRQTAFNGAKALQPIADPNYTVSKSSPSDLQAAYSQVKAQNPNVTYQQFVQKVSGQ